MTEQSSRSGSQAVDRAAALLAQVVPSPRAAARSPRWSTSRAGQVHHLPAAAGAGAQRAGPARRHGGFRPGAVFVIYACRAAPARTGDLVELAQPFLERLGRRPARRSTSACRRGWAVEQIAQVDSSFLLGATNWVGIAVPLHCSALGKVLLAYGAAADPRRARWSAAPASTITTAPTLARELADVRRPRVGLCLARSSSPAWSRSPPPCGAATARWSPRCRSAARPPGCPGPASAGGGPGRRPGRAVSQLLGYTQPPVRRLPPGRPERKVPHDRRTTS